MNNELKGKSRRLIDLLPKNLHGGTEEKYETMLRWALSRLRFKMGTF